MKIRLRHMIGALACALAAAPGALAQEKPRPPQIDSREFASAPYVLPNGVKGEPVVVPSASPADYGPLIKGETGPIAQLSAQLFLPANAKGPTPAIIETPGSGNLGPHHIAHAAALTSAGFAVLIVDPFFGRGIDNTIADQNKLSWAASAYDVLASVKYLRGRPEIDGGRIGAVGGSRGGTAAMMAASAPLSDAVLGAGAGLRAVVAGYPWCGVQFRSARLAARASLLVLQGDKDDWVSFQQCQDATHAMDVAGQNVVMKLFPGALHAFDRAGVPRTTIADAVTSTIFPTIYMTDEGVFYNMRTGAPDPAVKAADLFGYSVKGGFLHKGVTIGSAGDEAAEFTREMIDWFKTRL
ncbi:MAG TPA: prolyl oligopeptidase family serine peptidase [Rhodoblastus sp.]|nr:prolyl oligopeptidase family serine peptidase [Rhodoblastus sp.]